MSLEYKRLKLLQLNKKICDDLDKKFLFTSVGFFFDEDILFLGINPGYPYNKFHLDNALKMKNIEDQAEREKFYVSLLEDIYIGKFIKKIAGKNSLFDVSYTNIVKVPVENNDMLKVKELLNIYRHYTDEQIEILKPKIIICLGKFIVNEYFNINMNFNEIRKINDYEIILLRHPAYYSRRIKL